MNNSSVDYDTFESEGTLYSSASLVDGAGESSPLHRIRHCDLITFIAIAQSVDVTFVDIVWHQGLGSAGGGTSASTQQSLVSASTNLAFKKLVRRHDASHMYKTALSEILILQHPLIRAEENIINLYGVGWDVQKTEKTGEYEIVPVLMYENASQYGNLHSFMRDLSPNIQDVTRKHPWAAPLGLNYGDRLLLCIGIGKAIETMHLCNVIHGDLKPENILIFPSRGGQGYIPRVIDFGYSTYGFGDDDLVKLPCTEEWRAPEWHHRAFRIQDAKKTDIYSFAKICVWVLDFFHSDRCHWPKNEVLPHIRQFRQEGLCEDPRERTGDISLLLAILHRACSVEKGSFFNDLLQTNPLGFEKFLKDRFGHEEGLRSMNDVIREAHRHDSDVRNLFEKFDLKDQPHDTLGLRKELPRIPDVSKDFLDFQNIHFLIRVRIQKRLLELSKDEGWPRNYLKEIAFQLALCYELAFGVRRDVSESQKWLRVSGQEASQLSAVLDKSRYCDLRDREVHAMVAKSQSVDITYRYKATGLLDNAMETYSMESEGKLASLGPHASATLYSQNYVAMLLETCGRYDEAMDLLRHMLDASEKRWDPHASWPFILRLRISGVLAEQGDLLGAISLCESLLRVENWQQYDVETQYALSRYYGQICDFERSAHYIRQVWESRNNELGETHPSTVNALELLACAMTGISIKEAEVLETEVLERRRRVMGERNYVIIETMENLALVKAATEGKETEAIEMQRDALSRRAGNAGTSWLQLVVSTNRLACFQEKAQQLEEAIKTRDQFLTRKEDLLAYPEGLALLGNHARNLKAIGRKIEAEALRAQILQKVPDVLKPQPRIHNDVIKGVACAYLNGGRFDSEAAAIYEKTYNLWQRRQEEFGELHGNTDMVLRFLQLLSDQGHLVQSTIHILGLEHVTTKLAILRLKNRLLSYVEGDIVVEAYVSEVIDWINMRIASFQTTRG